MKGYFLSLDEASSLLGCSTQTVARLAEQDILDVEVGAAAHRVSLASIARYLGVHADQIAVQSAENVFRDRSAWLRVFGSHAETFAPGEFEHFPDTVVGSSLRRAIAISEIRSA